MPIPTSRNSVSLSPVGANFRDIDPTRHLDTISEAISTDDSQATQPTSRGFRDNALETDRGFRVGTESFANLNEIAVTPKSQKGVSSRVYQNTATANNGTISIDLHLTLIDTFDENGNKTTGTSRQLPVTFSDFFGGPILLARNVGSSAAGFEGHTAHIQVEFFDSGCGKPLDVIGDFTFRDIDFIAPGGTSTGTGSEAVTAVSAEIDSYQLSSEPATCITTEEENGNTRFINYRTNGSPDDEQHWARIRFHGNKSLNLTFRARNANTGYGLSTADFSSIRRESPTDQGIHTIINLSQSAIGRSGNAGVTQNGRFGDIVINSDGQYTYKLHSNADSTDLPPGQTREETFDYTVSHAKGGFSSATLTIKLPHTNLAEISGGTVPPQANIDRDSINALNISTYFSAPQGQLLSYSATNLPTGLSINPSTGEITGQLDNNASQDAPGGIFNVEATASATDGRCVSTTFDWKIANFLANQSSRQATGEASILEPLVDNNANNQGDAASFKQISNAARGVASPRSDGSFIYTASPNFPGTDSFEYEIEDDNGATSTATVTVTVEPATNPPVVSTAIPDQSHLDADTINVDISNNFSGEGREPLAFEAIGLPPGLSIDSAGSISGTIDSTASQRAPYTVVITASDRIGRKITDTFRWRISSQQEKNSNVSKAKIAAANGSPTVNTNIPDQTHTDGCAINVDISPNFSARNREALAFSATGLPPGLTIDSTGKISGKIVANAPHVAAYAAVIRAEDADGASVTDTFSWLVSAATPVAGNDCDSGNKVTFEKLTNPSNGSVVFNNGGCFTYTPAPGCSGCDKFAYLAIDASGAASPVAVRIETNPTSQANTNSVTRGMETDAGVAIQGDYGTVQINTDGSYTYALDSSNPAVESLASEESLNALTEAFQYTVEGEGGESVTTAIAITVNRVNRASEVESLPGQSNQSSDTLAIDLTPFSAGLDTDSLSFAVTGLPPGLSVSRGFVTGKIDPSVSAETYVVNVSVSDAKGGIVMDRFDWNIGGPEAAGDSFTTFQGRRISRSVVARDSAEPAGEQLPASLITTAPTNGAVFVSHDGSVTYTPNGGFPEIDSYEYEVYQQDEALPYAVVTVTAAPVSKPNSVSDFVEHKAFSGLGISQKIFSLSKSPFFTGQAPPRSRISGRIFDAMGSLVAESLAKSDPDGNWSMQFNKTAGHEFYQVEFKTDSIDESEVNFGLHPGGNSYQPMSPVASLGEPALK